jgi:mycoredoxin
MPPTIPIPDILTVYGAAWCGDCGRARRTLDAAGIEYRYVDLGEDPSSRSLLDAVGYRAIPVVVTPAGRILVEPSARELEEAVGIAG